MTSAHQPFRRSLARLLSTKKAKRAASAAAAVLVACAIGGGQLALNGSGNAGSPSPAADAPADATGARQATPPIEEGGSYTDKDDVALYIHTYGRLPGNFVSKTKAQKAGWNASEGNLDEVLPGKSIGGGHFYNDDGLLPDAKGRTWTECDIGYRGGHRGPERIVFSNDGLIYYTSDHYASFERLY